MKPMLALKNRTNRATRLRVQRIGQSLCESDACACPQWLYNQRRNQWPPYTRRISEVRAIARPSQLGVICGNFSMRNGTHPKTSKKGPSKRKNVPDMTV